ncbi:MAG: DUF4864 domain-containing protein [Pseudomonadota bacterium]
MDGVLRTQPLSKFILALCLGLAILVLPAASDKALAEDPGINAAQEVIREQIDAFLRDDAETAFSFASPGIKSHFGSPLTFMTMVKRGYFPVYRPQAFEFGPSSKDGTRIVQSLFITAQNGKLYEAQYALSQQEDGSWKITAVHLKEAEALAL